LVRQRRILLGKFVEINTLLQPESRAVEFRKFSIRKFRIRTFFVLPFTSRVKRLSVCEPPIRRGPFIRQGWKFLPRRRFIRRRRFFNCPGLIWLGVESGRFRLERFGLGGFRFGGFRRARFRIVGPGFGFTEPGIGIIGPGFGIAERRTGRLQPGRGPAIATVVARSGLLSR
jgi:hypothetical protein